MPRLGREGTAALMPCVFYFPPVNWRLSVCRVVCARRRRTTCIDYRDSCSVRPDRHVHACCPRVCHVYFNALVLPTLLIALIALSLALTAWIRQVAQVHGMRTWMTTTRYGFDTVQCVSRLKSLSRFICAAAR